MILIYNSKLKIQQCSKNRKNCRCKVDLESRAEINRVDSRCGQKSKSAAAPKSEGFAVACLMLPYDQ